MAQNDSKNPKPGQGSLLEGALDMSEDNKRPFGLLCGVIFARMSLGMCQQLNLLAGTALDGPLLSNKLEALQSQPLSPSRRPRAMPSPGPVS